MALALTDNKDILMLSMSCSIKCIAAGFIDNKVGLILLRLCSSKSMAAGLRDSHDQCILSGFSCSNCIAPEQGLRHSQSKSILLGSIQGNNCIVMVEDCMMLLY